MNSYRTIGLPHLPEKKTNDKEQYAAKNMWSMSINSNHNVCRVKAMAKQKIVMK